MKITTLIFSHLIAIPPFLESRPKPFLVKLKLHGKIRFRTYYPVSPRPLCHTKNLHYWILMPRFRYRPPKGKRGHPQVQWYVLARWPRITHMVMRGENLEVSIIHLPYKLKENLNLRSIIHFLLKVFPPLALYGEKLSL